MTFTDFQFETLSFNACGLETHTFSSLEICAHTQLAENCKIFTEIYKKKIATNQTEYHQFST